MLDSRVNSPTDTVPYHQQDTVHWCGSACAVMVLHSLGVSKAGGFALDQKRVRSVARNSARSDPTYQWVTAPDGLTAALNYFSERSDTPLVDKQGAGRSWELVAGDSEEEISRYIVWTLWHYKAPVVALVFGMMHWVVVGGCVTSRPPLSADDTGYEIIGFHICDPWPPIPRELARNDHFRHTDKREPDGAVVTMDGCGTGWAGDPDSDSMGGRGVALRYVSYNDWQVRDHSSPDRKRHSGYMLGVPTTLKLAHKPGNPEVKVRSRWVGKFIAICDPVGIAEVDEPAVAGWPMERILAGLAPRRPQNSVPEEQPSNPGSGGQLLRQITPEEAIEEARKALDTYHAYPLNGRTIIPAKPVVPPNLTADEPVLVECLDEPGSYLPAAAYYIVPFRSNDMQHAVVRVAARMPFWLWDKKEEEKARERLFLGLHILQKEYEERGKTATASALISEERARRRVAGRSFRGTQGSCIRVPNGYATAGKVVWRPCLESFDPCCPFYEYEIPAQGSSTEPRYLYVRAFDGQVFAHLTVHLGGA